MLKNSEWLKEELGDMDDDYILFDCPGQIELYTHMNTMKELVDLLEKWGFRLCCVFLLDAQFMVDGAKFISGIIFFCINYLFHKVFCNSISNFFFVRYNGSFKCYD